MVQHFAHPPHTIFLSQGFCFAASAGADILLYGVYGSSFSSAFLSLTLARGKPTFMPYTAPRSVNCVALSTLASSSVPAGSKDSAVFSCEVSEEL